MSQIKQPAIQVVANEVNSIDGYLIGGASTKIEEFTKIIDRCN